MRIDNSAAQKFWFCPAAYYERYVVGHTLSSENRDSLDFGSRFHDLQAERVLDGTTAGIGKLYPPLADPRLEAECQATFAAWLQHYPTDEFEVLDAERTLEVPLPSTHHTYVFKMDLIFRNSEGLSILDYKTQKRGGQNNSAEAWAAKPQIGLYQWAAEQFYHEPIRGIYIDLTTRQSPKGNEPPLFERMRLVRTSEQRQEAVRNITWVADQIEAMEASGFIPQDRDACKQGWKKCEYYQLHILGRTDGNLKLYQPAEAYLGI